MKFLEFSGTVLSSFLPSLRPWCLPIACKMSTLYSKAYKTLQLVPVYLLLLGAVSDYMFFKYISCIFTPVFVHVISSAQMTFYLFWEIHTYPSRSGSEGQFSVLLSYFLSLLAGNPLDGGRHLIHLFISSVFCSVCHIVSA